MNTAHPEISEVASGTPPDRRVLLVMPPDIAPAAQPHLGLGILGTRLTEAGRPTLVVDYAYRPKLPPIESFLRDFRPGAVGITVFSQHLTKTRDFIARVHRALPSAPIVLGGPHVTIAEDDGLAELRQAGARVFVKGEAEDRIVDVIDAARSGATDAVVCDPPDLSRPVWPDFRNTVDGRSLTTYPMQLSRGCPYRCVFCNVKRIAGRKFRARDIADGVAEVAEAVRRYPRLQFVKVTDDAPNCVPERIEDFLERYLERGLHPRMEIMQLRADNLTARIAALLARARAPYVVVGVESGEPGVFEAVKKGETLEDIRRACAHVKKEGLPLVMCFVLGMPGATPEKDRESVRFAREMGPVHCYWNVAQPMPGTEMHEYFVRHGAIRSSNVAEESSLDGKCTADTPEYPALERLRMQLLAQATTNEVWRHLPYFLTRGARLGILWDAVRALTIPRPRIPRGIRRRW